MGMAKSKDDLIIEQLQRDNKELREENERVRQANLHTMDVFEDIKAAKEKAEARVAAGFHERLVDALDDVLCLIENERPDWDYTEQREARALLKEIEDAK